MKTRPMTKRAHRTRIGTLVMALESLEAAQRSAASRMAQAREDLRRVRKMLFEETAAARKAGAL